MEIISADVNRDDHKTDLLIKAFTRNNLSLFTSQRFIIYGFPNHFLL